MRIDTLSDWDDWSCDEPEWWLKHPLYRPAHPHQPRTRLSPAAATKNPRF